MDGPGHPAPGGGDLIVSRRSVRILVPFGVVGTAGILAGGGVAAAARPVGWDSGSWAAAYLVLVVGLGSWVGGLTLGLVPARDGGPPRTADRRATPLLAGWIASNAAILTGNLLDVRTILVLGSVLLLLVLIASAYVLRRDAAASPWLTAYSAGVVLLAVSMPIGLLLAAR